MRDYTAGSCDHTWSLFIHGLLHSIQAEPQWLESGLWSSLVTSTQRQLLLSNNFKKVPPRYQPKSPRFFLGSLKRSLRYMVTNDNVSYIMTDPIPSNWGPLKNRIVWMPSFCLHKNVLIMVTRRKGWDEHGGW